MATLATSIDCIEKRLASMAKVLLLRLTDTIPGRVGPRIESWVTLTPTPMDGSCPILPLGFAFAFAYALEFCGETWMASRLPSASSPPYLDGTHACLHLVLTTSAAAPEAARLIVRGDRRLANWLHYPQMVVLAGGRIGLRFWARGVAGVWR